MGSKLRKFFLILLLLLIGTGAVLFLKETTRWPAGKLSDIQRQIDSQVKATYKTGQDGKVTFTFSERDVILVISPPYVKISDLGKDIFSPALLSKMQSFVDSQETGHLFYIKQGNLADHRLLSGLAEPVLGKAMKKDVVILISRKLTSGRPVRIEILN
jgi:hypothetical protein